MLAEAIARALGGRKVGDGWMVRCMAHDDHEPSLFIRNGVSGKLLAFCYAGCDQRRVIDTLRARGLWPDTAHQPRSTHHHGQFVVTGQPARDGQRRTEAALRIWQSTQAAADTVVDTYLRSRGIEIPIPPAVRFHPALRHPSGRRWPAMVARVSRGTDGTTAIHRTFLNTDGKGKASVQPQKMMLGPCRGAGVRLAEPGELLMVGEGIETCLAAMQVTGHPAWAALSTSGLCTLQLPQSVRNVIVLADGDEPGVAAAEEAAQRWSREDRRVRIAHPQPGCDFNDMLLGHESRSEASQA